MGFGYSFPAGYAPGPVSNPAAVAPKGNALAQDASAAAQVGNGPGHPHESLPASDYNPAQPYTGGLGGPQIPNFGQKKGSTLPAGPTGIEDNPYIGNFQKSLAASRGAIAAQIAAAMHEIGTNEAAGQADVNAFGTSLGTMNTDEHNSLNALAASADKSAAAGGLQSYTSAKATTNPLAAAGDMATHFSQGAVPLLHQGVGAQAQAQTNALQQEGLTLNAQLDQEMRQFDAQQANDIAQRNFAREQSYTGQQNALALQTHDATLRAAAANGTPLSDPIVKQHLVNVQNKLDKAGITNFTSEDVYMAQQSPQYKNIAAITDPQQRAAVASKWAAQNPGNPLIDIMQLNGVLPAGDLSAHTQWNTLSNGPSGWDNLDLGSGAKRVAKDVTQGVGMLPGSPTAPYMIGRRVARVF